jgi:hypothetical protein
MASHLAYRDFALNERKCHAARILDPMNGRGTTADAG